jgi:hypothetical protein
VIAEARTLALLFLATAASYAVGLAVGVPWLLPLLNAAPAYVLMARRLRAGDPGGAIRAMLIWALFLAVCGTLLFACWPSDPGPLILNGPQYRDEMFHWIRTGEGSEGSIRLFLPQHLLHVGVFALLSLASASVVSIAMGAVLMNYMAYYVAALARAGAPLWTVTLLGWQPWAIVRIAGFCMLGALLAEPLLSRLFRYPYPGLASRRRLFAVALGGIVGDWILKAVLAPQWGLWLRAQLP